MFTLETYRNRSAFQTKPKIKYKAIFLFCEIIACTRKSLWEQLAKMRIKSNRKETWAVVNKCAIHHMHLMLFSIPTSIAVIGTCIFFSFSTFSFTHVIQITYLQASQPRFSQRTNLSRYQSVEQMSAIVM